MKLKSLQVLSFYYLIYFGIVTTAVALGRDYFVERLALSLVVAGTFFLAPLLMILIAELKPSFAKWLRVSFFQFFRVNTFIQFSFVILVLFGSLFVYNYVSFGFSGQQIFLNVFFVNLILLFFVSLLLAKRIQVSEPQALLIQKIGTPEVYLYRDGVLRHIPDPPTLQLLGHSFADIHTISEKEFQKYKSRPPLESVSTGRLVQAIGKAEVYIIVGDEKLHVPDLNTLIAVQQLNAQAGGKRLIDNLPAAEVDKWPTGKPLRSVIQP